MVKRDDDEGQQARPVVRPGWPGWANRHECGNGDPPDKVYFLIRYILHGKYLVHDDGQTRQMRAALIRSRTRKGFAVNIELYQSPVILYVQPDEVNVTSINRTVPLSFAVTVNGDSSRSIGGITVRRQVLLRRKVPKTKQKWTDWEEIQSQEVHLVADCQIHGRQRFECSMPLPAKLPETRQTHYDQLIHLLTATVHDKAPEYVTHRKHARNRAASTPSTTSEARAGLEEDYPRICTKELEAVTTKEADVVAESKKVFEVVHSGNSHGELPTLDAEQTLRLSDSGKAKVKLHSDLFVLGSTLNVAIDFLDLTLDTTIHAMSIKMVQETATPIKTAIPEDISSPVVDTAHSATPAPDHTNSRPASLRRRSDRPLLSRLSSLFAGVKEKPSSPQTSIIDEYVLHSEGVDHYVNSQGFGVRPGMYLWRGEAGRNLDRTRSQEDAEEYLDEYKLDHQAAQENAILRTISSLRMNRSVRLPSELQDAHPTSSTLAPVLARISHRIAVNIIYSILGQDAHGKAIFGQATEGAMRQVTLVFEVGLMPCVAVPSTIRPPAYADEEDDMPELIAPAASPRRMFRRFSMETVRPASLHRHDSHVNAATSANKSTAERIIAASIHHSRAFRASNGLVVTGNRVFYSDQEVEEAVTRHQREKGSCACLM